MGQVQRLFESLCRPSHRPLLAVLSEVHFLLHGLPRSGNCGISRGMEEFLKEALAPWGHRQKIRLDGIRKR
jgi:hypothetical protein